MIKKLHFNFMLIAEKPKYGYELLKKMMLEKIM